MSEATGPRVVADLCASDLVRRADAHRAGRDLAYLARSGVLSMLFLPG